MKVAIFLFNVNLNNFNLSSYYKIGCDRGALNASLSNINLDVAIGDFDSVNDKEFEIIKNNSKELIKLNPIKDKTDVEEALDLALKFSSDITIFGGIQGKRIEHFLSILKLFNKYPNIKIIDDNSIILNKYSSFKFNKDDYKDYKYVSFIELSDNMQISLKGFKYNLDNRVLTNDDISLLISNEMVSDSLEVSINKPLLIVFSKSDNNYLD